MSEEQSKYNVGLNVVEVIMYKTTDGETFTSKLDATKHQNSLNYKNKLRSILEAKWHRGIDIEDVIDILEECREELR